MKLFQIPTLAWALALALSVMTSRADYASASKSLSGSGSTTTTTATTIGATAIPHDKIDVLIAQAVVAALVSETSSDTATTLAQARLLLLGWLSLPARIEIELDRLEIGGVALPALEVWRANTKSSAINFGNLKIYKAHRGSN